MSRRKHLTERPEYFRINPDWPLAESCVFAGLGRFPGGLRYDDAMESLWGNGNHGTLTNMAIPATATSGWQWDNHLRRMVLAYDGSSDYVLVPYSAIALPYTVIAWMKINTAANKVAWWRGKQGTGATAWDAEYLSITSGYKVTVSSVHNNVFKTATSVGYFDVGVWVNTMSIFGSTTDRRIVFKGVVAQNTEESIPEGMNLCNIGCDSSYSGVPENFFPGSLADQIVLLGDWSVYADAFADPSNVDLRINGIPGILPVWQRVYGAAVAAAVTARSRIIGAGVGSFIGA